MEIIDIKFSPVDYKIDQWLFEELYRQFGISAFLVRLYTEDEVTGIKILKVDKTPYGATINDQPHWYYQHYKICDICNIVHS